MRALFVFGFIALYIAFAFVPPSQSNVRSIAKQVQSATKISTVADVVKAASSITPDAKATVGDLLHAMTQTSSASSALAELAKTDVHQSIRTQLERIQWAASKRDPRLCKALGEGTKESQVKDQPSFGQLLALCLARATGEGSRCNSIDDPTLHAACIEGLVTITTTLL